MNPELLQAIKTVLFWLIALILSRACASVFGVTGNQLAKARMEIDKTRQRAVKLAKDLVSDKSSDFYLASHLNKVVYSARRANRHMSLYNFEHRENKRTADPGKESNAIFLALKELPSDLVRGRDKSEISADLEALALAAQTLHIQEPQN